MRSGLADSQDDVAASAAGISSPPEDKEMA